MGGDGGTNAVSRAYLRGAGSASTTGDDTTTNRQRSKQHDDPQIEQQEALYAMQHCYISDQLLNYNSIPSTIVTCRYGRLYNKEAVIEALLNRKQRIKSNLYVQGDDRLGSHIRGLKDIYTIRFQTIVDDKNEVRPVCPITGRELNGTVIAYALIPGHIDDDNMINVVSEYALKQLREDDVLLEYGATKKIRLLSPKSTYTDIQNSIDIERNNEVIEKEQKKKQFRKEKRKRTVTEL